MQIKTDDVRMQFRENSNVYLDKEGIITHSALIVNDPGVFRVDVDNSESILQNSYIYTADLEHQAENLNGHVHSFPPEYWTDEAPPLEHYVKLGAVARTHDISAATIERYGPNDVLVTIPPAPETTLLDALQARVIPPLHRIVTNAKWEMLCR
jgi:hypothetical protein